MELVLEIPEARYLQLKHRVKRAAVRARKSGLPVPSLTKIAESHREFEVYDALAKIRGADSSSRRAAVPMVTVRLSGFTPMLGDWETVGYRFRLRTATDRVDVRYSGHFPQDISARDLCCDHCGYNRQRISTVVLKGSDGRFVEVGNNCVSAFTGYNGGYGFAEGLAETGTILREIQQAAREDLLSSGFDLAEEVRTVLAVAHRHVADHGFMNSSYREDATWRSVHDDLVRYRREDLSDDDISVTAGDFMAADEIIQHFRTLSDRRDSDFALAVTASIDRGLAGLRDVAVLTAAAHVYRRHVDKEAKLARGRSMAATSAPVGEPGERIEFVGKVHTVRTYEGQWGTTAYITMFDGDGNLLHWKASRNPDVREGQAYEMRGTVKGHRECEKGPFQGANETVLTRVAVTAELGPVSFDGEASPAPAISDEDSEALDMLFGGMHM